MVSIRPDIPVILCSGFSEMISDEQAKTLGIRAFVMKPLSIQDLAEVARKVLEEKKQ
jgi:CheY-like chemotaxis protein